MLLTKKNIVIVGGTLGIRLENGYSVYYNWCFNHKYDPLWGCEKINSERCINLALLPSHQAVGDPEVDNQLDWYYESYRKSLSHLYQWGN